MKSPRRPTATPVQETLRKSGIPLLHNAAGALLLALSATSWATPVHVELVKDIDTSGSGFDEYFDIGGMLSAAVGDLLFFVRHTDTNSELWRTDGSSAGTFGIPTNSYVRGIAARTHGVVLSLDRPPPSSGNDLVRASADLNLSSPIWTSYASVELMQEIPVDGLLFDCADTGFTNHCAIPPGQNQGSVIFRGYARALGTQGDAVILAGYSRSNFGAHGIWRSDGTVPGTFRIADDLNIGAYPTVAPVPATLHAGRIWFIACTEAFLCGLYATDGTRSGTQQIASLQTVPRGEMKPLRNGVAWIPEAGDAELWFSDGTPGGTRPLATSAANSRVGLATTGDYVHYVTSTSSAATYHVSDGTVAGTRPIALPAQIQPINGRPVALDANTVAFRCTSPATGDELCIVDAEGKFIETHDIFPGPSPSGARLLGTTRGSAYLVADDGSHGRELWRVYVREDAIFHGGFEVTAP